MRHLFAMMTPVGILCVKDDGNCIVSVQFDGKKILSPESDLQKETETELREYFEGKRKAFDLPVLLRGSDFQNHVWNALRKIPYGRTVSYQKIAEMIGNRKACRAVGMAIHQNPVPVIIPCHRVIRKDGTIGGYVGGTERKKILLDMEREYESENNQKNAGIGSCMQYVADHRMCWK